MSLRISLLVFLVASPAFAADDRFPDSSALTAKIDQALARAWLDEGVQPAQPATDAAFLRRVTLDLFGRIPTVAEARSFLDDGRPDKRQRLIDRLLASPGHASHFAATWRRIWFPQTDEPTFDHLAKETERWIASRLQAGTPLNTIVGQLITAKAQTSQEHVPHTFALVNEAKPENLAANLGRAFLGINLQCAQCHNHPFARWTRKQFWETAAFFAASPGRGMSATALLPQLTIAGTDIKVQPRLLGGADLAWPADRDSDTGRRLLAQWTTAQDNPYFAANAVNQLWASLFGTGLIEPLDDLTAECHPSRRALLELLATDFRAHNFNLHHLTRAMVLSRAYQLSSLPGDDATRQQDFFARMPVRGLTGEQLFDSLLVAAGFPPADSKSLPGDSAFAAAKMGGPMDRRSFVGRFQIARSPTAERSIVQQLSLMNGALLTELTNPRSPFLSVLVTSPFLDDRERIDTLFLATLSRPPTASERSRLQDFVQQAEGKNDGKALADIFWALLVSTEFNTNH